MHWTQLSGLKSWSLKFNCQSLKRLRCFKLGADVATKLKFTMNWQFWGKIHVETATRLTKTLFTSVLSIWNTFATATGKNFFAFTIYQSLSYTNPKESLVHWKIWIGEDLKNICFFFLCLECIGMNNLCYFVFNRYWTRHGQSRAWTDSNFFKK
jgi:hypothetical protein